ncbi:MAG: hypothetical protein IPP38_10935 [Bacteroidetes bacterium]|nr:hypothetical protein [Bacteroidota bacterium]
MHRDGSGAPWEEDVVLPNPRRGDVIVFMEFMRIPAQAVAAVNKPGFPS